MLYLDGVGYRANNQSYGKKWRPDIAKARVFSRLCDIGNCINCIDSRQFKQYNKTKNDLKIIPFVTAWEEPIQYVPKANRV